MTFFAFAGKSIDRCDKSIQHASLPVASRLGSAMIIELSSTSEVPVRYGKATPEKGKLLSITRAGVLHRNSKGDLDSDKKGLPANRELIGESLENEQLSLLSFVRKERNINPKVCR